MTIQQQKAQIRSQILAHRAQLGESERRLASEQICTHLIAFPAYQQANTILAYLNFGTEFLSELWVKQVLMAGKKLFLPRVNNVTKTLDIYQVSDIDQQLEVGSWGIREPIVEQCFQLEALNEVEFILLPGVGFTKNGDRLGYGGGFYDKLLSRMTTVPPLVAAAFSLQIVDYLPQEKTDKKVTSIITEQSVINCSAQI